LFSFFLEIYTVSKKHCNRNNSETGEYVQLNYDVKNNEKNGTRQIFTVTLEYCKPFFKIINGHCKRKGATVF